MAFVQQKAQVWAKKAFGPSFDPQKAPWTVFLANFTPRVYVLTFLQANCYRMSCTYIYTHDALSACITCLLYDVAIFIT